MKRPPIKGQRHGWVVVDGDGEIRWAFAFELRRDAAKFATKHCRLVKVAIVEPKKRKARRGRR